MPYDIAGAHTGDGPTSRAGPRGDRPRLAPFVGIAATAYPKLRAGLGLEPRPIYVYDPIQQLAIVDDDVLDWAGADAIELGRGFCREEKWWADWTLPGGIEELYPEHMWTGIASPPGPSAATPAELAEGARRLRGSTDRAIVGLFGGNLLEMGQFYYRMDNFLAMLAEEPLRAHRFLDALVEIHLQNLETYTDTALYLYNLLLVAAPERGGGVTAKDETQSCTSRVRSLAVPDATDGDMATIYDTGSRQPQQCREI